MFYNNVIQQRYVFNNFIKFIMQIKIEYKFIVNKSLVIFF
jgi:hypothetical protein